jgi:UDP-N-acetylglucosamine/UDP-N-acetylgalactosamine diphosphorylase
MLSVPTELRRRFQEFGQEHVFTWWDQLNDRQRGVLVDRLNVLDLPQLRRLYAQRDQPFLLPNLADITPVPVIRPGPDDASIRRLGEDCLHHGEVAVLMVAGGQGSRLGFEHPKGMFSVGPVSQKSLFAIHAEKVLALRRRHGKPVPFLVMTSPATHTETEAYFADQEFFGMSRGDVLFFCQGTMPALDLATGQLLMEAPHRPFLSPNGHGGTLTALADCGLLTELRRRGIRQVFYFQVDNPLVLVADPLFLGHHLAHRAEVSSKVLPKQGPFDKLGNFVQVKGRCTIIEYSDLPEDLARQPDEKGNLRFGSGSPAIHWFAVDFLDRLTADLSQMPFHLARKKVSYLDENGQVVQPQKENALKFERFIFDALPLADRWTVVETTRQEEFEPLKNATGADSPESVRQAQSDRAAAWLERAGVQVPRRAGGKSEYPLEISALFALDADEVVAKVERRLSIQGPTYLSGK